MGAETRENGDMEIHRELKGTRGNALGNTEHRRRMKNGEMLEPGEQRGNGNLEI